MKNLAAALLLFFSAGAGAQGPLNVRGVYQSEIYNRPHLTLPVSLSGTSVAIPYGSENYTFVDVTTGAIRQPERNLRSISPDHRFVYVNTPLPDTVLSRNGNWVYVWGIRAAGTLTDTANRNVAYGYTALGMTPAGQLVVTKSTGDALKGKITREGLYLMDPATGAVVKTLRTDALLTCGMPGDGCGYAMPIVQPGYAALYHEKTVFDRPMVHVYPFDAKGGVVSIALNSGETVAPSFADTGCIYALSGVRYTSRGEHYTGLQAYSRRTGNMLASQSWPDSGYAQMLYAFANNRIYRYDILANTAYEEKVTGNTIQTVKSWKAAPGFSLPAEQRWWMAVCKGPSLFFVPDALETAEKGGAAANAASLLHLPSGKVTFSIFPFYVRTPEVAAAQEAERQKWAQYWADKTSPAGKAAENAKQQRYAVGTMFKRPGTLTQSTADFIVIGFHAASADYVVLQREFVDARNTFFKTDDNIAFYNVQQKTMSAYALGELQEVSGKVHVCPVCTGSGVVQEEVVHSRGGSWEQVGFNIEVYTPAHVIASWKERAVCPRCTGKGVLPR